MKFKQNAENFFQFYLSSKQRNHRGSNTKNQNVNENEQNYDGLKTLFWVWVKKMKKNFSKLYEIIQMGMLRKVLQQ